ncbi:MAG: TIGR03032 family protein [Spirochaetaceae bacterium]|nr:MAG: TIGR03032 family protein [Spirochaetaceae bacterium]
MSTSPDPALFQLTCTPAVPELLRTLRCTIALSTYQAGKLVFISAVDNERLVQLPRTFARPMALGWRDGALVVSTASTVELFVNEPRAAAAYPRQPDTYDALYLPRQTWQTGHIDAHGLEWDASGNLWVVNTKFGCLAKLSSSYSFEPVWFPPFVTELAPEDRCHLNGVAFRSGAPVYATCLAPTNATGGWRKRLPNAGLLIDMRTNDVVLSDLPMPHSPRFVGDALYLLFSATGELARIDVKRRLYDVVAKIGGFVRGMAYHRSHLFIAYSKLRKNSSTFRDLPIAEEATESGVAIVHEPTGTLVGRLSYLQSVDEIFDVVILPEQLRPGIVGLDRDERSLAISAPTSSWWVLPKPTDGSTAAGSPKSGAADQS